MVFIKETKPKKKFNNNVRVKHNYRKEKLLKAYIGFLADIKD